MTRRRSLPRLLAELAVLRVRQSVLDALARREHTWVDVTEFGDRYRRFQCTRCPATKTVRHDTRPGTFQNTQETQP